MIGCEEEVNRLEFCIWTPRLNTSIFEVMSPEAVIMRYQFGRVAHVNVMNLLVLSSTIYKFNTDNN